MAAAVNYGAGDWRSATGIDADRKLTGRHSRTASLPVANPPRKETLVGIGLSWKSAFGVLIGMVLAALLLPIFSAQAQSSSVLALVRGRGATLYDQPGGDALRTLSAGDRLDATGRTEDATWITGAAADDLVGWLRVEDVIIYDLLTLPVVDGVSAPQMQPTATATRSVAVAAPTATPTIAPTVAPTATPTATQPPTPTPSPTPLSTPTPLLPPSSGGSVTGVARGGGAQLRTGPEGTVLEQVEAGAALTVVGRSGDGMWLLATDVGGVTGWVARSQVVAFGVDSVPLLPLPAVAVAAQPALSSAPVVGNSEGALAGTVVVGGSRLNVRSGPGATYAIVAKEEDGAQLLIQARSENGAWFRVALADGGFGWVAARFVATEGNSDDLSVSDAISAASALAAPVTSLPISPAPISHSSISQSPNPPGLTGKLALASADGSIVLYDLTSGTANRLTAGFDPAISPDGSKIAFLRGGQGLLVINADGSNERLLYGGGAEMRAPAWSPDGRFVVFSRVNGQDTCRSLGFGICLPDNPQLSQYPLVRKDLRILSRIGLDGDGFRDIPTLDTATSPSWTVSGIVYQSNSGLQITQDGPERDKEGNLVNRALTAEYLHRDPDWRSDGGRIVLMDATANHQEIYTINPDGSGLTPLTRPASALLKTLPHNVAPVWSPDGEHVAFLSNREGDWAVYVMEEDGSNPRRLDIEVEMEYRFQNEQMVSWGR